MTEAPVKLPQVGPTLGARTAALLAVALALGLRVIVRADFCDVAYITIQTAVNLVRDVGLELNAGQRVFVSTSPLWGALIALGQLVCHDVLLATQLLGAASEAALAVALVALGERIG